jgi:hypothetical protein
MYFLQIESGDDFIGFAISREVALLFARDGSSSDGTGAPA